MRRIQQTRLDPLHPDHPLISEIEDELLARGGGPEGIRSRFPALVRQAIDEVIDMPRTGRVDVAELEKTEKTYIGTKVEILVRAFFDLPKGKLDLRVRGHDVDVKNTIGGTWMIPNEAVGKPCILVASDEARRLCYFGIFVAHPAALTSGRNQDQKRSVSSSGFANIQWLLPGEPYPESLWSIIGKEATARIMGGRSGNERIQALFREVRERPIHRDTIETAARQKDYMKRVRKNGGARDGLSKEGIAVLQGSYDSSLIARLGLPDCSAEEFISYRPVLQEHVDLLRGLDKIA